MGYLAHPDGTPATKESIVGLLKQEKLTTNSTRDKAGDIGTVIHQAAESYFQTSVLPDPANYIPEVQPKLRGLIRYLSRHDPIPTYTEQVVASKIHGSAGKLDFAGIADGKNTLLDFKSGTYLPLEHGLQLAGYEGLGKESGFLIHDNYQRQVIQLLEDDFKIHDCTYTFDDYLSYLKTFWISQRK